MEKLNGTIIAVNSYDHDNHTIIARCRYQGNKVITIVGQADAPLVIDQDVELEGDFENDAIFGTRFLFETLNLLPLDPFFGLRAYLSSNRFEGIGKLTANRIIDKYGKHALKAIMRQDPGMKTIAGLTQKKSLAAYTVALKYKKQHNTFVELMQYGFTFSQVEKLVESYGDTTLNVVHENPYALIRMLDDLNFTRLDTLAKRMGVASDDPNRLKAALVAVVSTQCFVKGNTYVAQKDLLQQASELIHVDKDMLFDPLNELVETKVLVRKFVRHNVYTFPFIFEMEVRLAQRIVKLLKQPLSDSESLNQMADNMVLESPYRDHKAYIDALKLPLNQRVVCIDSAVATPVAPLVMMWMGLFTKVGLKCVVASPNGLCAKSASEGLHVDAIGIFRLLESYYDPDTATLCYGRNKEHRCEQDVYILTQTHLMNIDAMSAFFNAVPLNSRVILIGDIHQYPSIGCGDVFEDMIASNVVPSIQLDVDPTFIPTDIETACNGLLHGQYPNHTDEGNVHVVETESSADVFLATLEAIRQCVDGLDSETPLSAIQTICARRGGNLGSDHFNSALQPLLNRHSEHAKYLHAMITVHEKDRLLQLVDSLLQPWRSGDNGQIGAGVFKGDMGTVERIDADALTATVLFDDQRRAVYSQEHLDQLTYGYAIPVNYAGLYHFSHIFIPVCAQCGITRDLLYTAMCCADRSVTLIGTKADIESVIGDETMLRRKTMLADLLNTFKRKLGL